MTLGFKTKIGNEPTLFVEKIWTALNLGIGEYQLEFKERQEWLKKCIYSFNLLPEFLAKVPPKIHTIRTDTKNRWRVGLNIHFVINNRTPKRFQFAPLLPVKSIQQISIKYENSNSDFPTIHIDGKKHSIFVTSDVPILEKLAMNDGFESFGKFLDYFHSDFDGKIIHWTDFVYY